MDLLLLDEALPGLIDALLGADLHTVRREWGLTTRQVSQLRAALPGVVAHWCAGMVPEAEGVLPHPSLARHPGIELVLGKLPDSEVAARFGLSRERVWQLRAQAAVRLPTRSASRPPPPPPPVAPSPRRVREPWPLPGWKGPRAGAAYVAKLHRLCPGLIEALPQHSTAVLARRFGLDKKAIRCLRAFLDIPSPVSSGGE